MNEREGDTIVAYTIRDMKLSELKKIYRLIKKDFASGEYAPYEVFYQQIKSGVQSGFIFLEGGQDAAYSICAGSHPNGYVLISLLAVYEELRGRGVGSKFVEKLIELYSGRQGIIVEVEKPENAGNDNERDLRTKRIEFYKKAGFYLVPNIEYVIWDAPMHLMVLPCKALQQDINKNIDRTIYYIYLELMGERYMHKLKFKRMD